MTGRQEMLVLHRARHKNNYKNLTVGQATRVLVKAESQLNTRRITLLYTQCVGGLDEV